jgi:hypothetical protein
MNREPDMTESERNLLGPSAAGERWLADRLDSADRARPMPADLSARLMLAIRREVTRSQARASRHNWRIAAAAAALLFALVGGYTALMWSNRPVQRIDDTYYEAWVDVESYILWVDASMRTVDRVNASLSVADGAANQVQREIAQLNQEVASAESGGAADSKNPWTPVADVILAGR